MKEDIFHLGVKAILRNRAGEILILRVNLETFTGRKTPEHWDLPGGRIQKGEKSIEVALRREVEEEIGVKNIKNIKLLDASISKMRLSFMDAGLILFTYLCEIDKAAQIKLVDDEHTEFKWVIPKEAAKLLSTKFSDSLINIIKNLK
ncbi:MAG: NUDIX hydrolase [Candidatus Daviesbacteria bacterium]